MTYQLSVMIAVMCWPLGASEAADDFGTKLFHYGGNAKMTFTASGRSVKAIACAKCHGSDAEGAGEGNQIAPNITWAALTETERNTGVYDLAQFRNSLETGHAPDGRQFKAQMPRYQLSPDEAVSLVGYLKTISGKQRIGLTPDTVRVALPTGDTVINNGQDYLRGLVTAVNGKIPWGRQIEFVRDAPDQAFLQIDPTGTSFSVDVAGTRKTISFCGNTRAAIDVFVADHSGNDGRLVALSDAMSRLAGENFPPGVVIEDSAEDVLENDALLLLDGQSLPQDWPSHRLRRIYAIERTNVVEIVVLQAHARDVAIADLCVNMPRPSAASIDNRNVQLGYATGVALVDVLAAAGRHLTKHRFVQAAFEQEFEHPSGRWQLVEAGKALSSAIKLHHIAGN